MFFRDFINVTENQFQRRNAPLVNGTVIYLAPHEATLRKRRGCMCPSHVHPSEWSLTWCDGCGGSLLHPDSRRRIRSEEIFVSDFSVCLCEGAVLEFRGSDGDGLSDAGLHHFLFLYEVSSCL